MPETKIELGDEVRDLVTSFTGVVIGITTWLNGCRRMVIQPRQLGEKGQMPSHESLDEMQLIIVEKHVVATPNRLTAAESPRAPEHGGPRPDPAQHATPRQF